MNSGKARVKRPLEPAVKRGKLRTGAKPEAKPTRATSSVKTDQQLFDVVQDDDTLLWLRARQPSNREFEVDKFLDHFLALVSRDTFLNNVYHKRAFAVTGLGGERFAKLLSEYFCNGDPHALIEQTASHDGVSVWLANPEARAINSFKVQDPELVQSLFSTTGASIYLRAPPQTCERLTLSAFRDLGIALGMYPSDCKSRGEVEVFLASRPSKRTPTHTDFQENFTLQLLGRKRWRVHPGDVTNPLRAKSPHFANTPMSVVETQLLASQICGGSSQIDPPPDSSAGWRSVDLNPGDVLYHPPGIWHNVETLQFEDPVCMNVNISLVAPTWADLVASSVRQLMWASSDVFRRPSSVFEQPEASLEVKSFLKSLAERFDLNWTLPTCALESLTAAAALRRDEDESEDNQDVTQSMVFSPSDVEPEAFKAVKRNPLASLLLDSDLEGDEAEDQSDDEEGLSAIVHINSGDDDLESKCRFELQELPRSSLRALIALRSHDPAQQLSWRQYIGWFDEDAAVAEVEAVASLLIKSGFLLKME